MYSHRKQSNAIFRHKYLILDFFINSIDLFIYTLYTLYIYIAYMKYVQIQAILINFTKQ